MNKEEILYQIVAIDSELKKGFPDKISTILRNGNTGKTYTDYDFKNHRYLYCYVSDNFNIYDRLEEKDKEIERLNNIIDKINKLLECDTHCENIYYAIGVLLNHNYFDIEDIENEEILNILKEGKNER